MQGILWPNGILVPHKKKTQHVNAIQIITRFIVGGILSEHDSNIICLNLPPPRQTGGRVLASSVGGHGFNPQSRTASYQRRYKNGNSSALVQHSTLKREILVLSQELRQENNVMDKIWYRNPSKSEVIGRCGGDEKNE